jgi:hypothetical protein
VTFLVKIDKFAQMINCTVSYVGLAKKSVTSFPGAFFSPVFMGETMEL